ncbi:hypothetical protein J437_LFUL012758 [Ladona fulva]|uniref:Alpha-macroglobulin receptor-binding domain-containing protein n=1 Tax=Ladona fulva TaxID=123851 RepID=A0A8K0KV40_LADFU|nr:hypothetical protein J437_LFUL012758 [Ladona fulva]
MSYQYNLNVTGAWPLFTLDPQVDKNSNVNHLQLSVCSGYVGGNASNMALMEVFLPSGFYVDQDSLPSLRVSPSVKRVETYNDGTSIALYFDQMMVKEYCPTISAYRTHGVAWNRPVPVIMFDYYDMSRKARVFYKPIKSNPCDLCNEDRNEPSCLLSCGISNQPLEGESGRKGGIPPSNLKYSPIKVLLLPSADAISSGIAGLYTFHSKLRNSRSLYIPHLLCSGFKLWNLLQLSNCAEHV